MDSKEYFEKAERANNKYHAVVIGLLLIAILVLIAASIAVFTLNTNNHRNSVNQLEVITQNEIKLNQNLSGSIKCILLLTPQTYNAENVNKCFAVHDNLTPLKIK